MFNKDTNCRTSTQGAGLDTVVSRNDAEMVYAWYHYRLSEEVEKFFDQASPSNYVKEFQVLTYHLFPPAKGEIEDKELYEMRIQPLNLRELLWSMSGIMEFICDIYELRSMHLVDKARNNLE